MRSRLQRIKSSINDSNGRMSADFKDLLGASEDLLRSTAAYTGDGVDDARNRLKRQLEHARAAAGGWQRVAAERYDKYVHASDDYVREHPWRSVGVAAVLGAAISLILYSGRER